MKESADIERQGSMMVEACLLIPICVFLLVAMAGAFQFLRLEESVLFSGFNQLERSSVAAELLGEGAPVESLFLGYRIEKQVKSEQKEGSLEARHSSVAAIPDMGGDGDTVSCRVLCAYYLGGSQAAGVFSDQLRFSSRAFSGEDEISVWIFPNWGERYHREDCRVNGGERRRMLRMVAVENGYTPCKICFGEEGEF